MAVFHINRTNDAVFKAIFAKYSKITLAPYQCFPGVPGYGTIDGH